MNEIKPNGQRAKVAIILIWIMLVLEVISLISGYLQYNLLQIAVNGGEIPQKSADANDSREEIIALIYLIFFIISAVTFIQWFRRAYNNLHFRVKNLSYTEGWAAGSWFVPIISLFRPYQIMKELYLATIQLLKRNGNNISLNTNYLGIWWTLWIINNIIGQIVFRYSERANTIDEIVNSTTLSIVNNLIGIPLALVTIKVIKDYSNIEHLLINKFSNLDQQ